MNIRTICLAALIMLSATGIFAQQSLQGKWQTGVDNTVIETYQKDGSWFGKIVSSDNSKAKAGMDILRNFTADGDSWKGQLFAPKKNKWVDAVIESVNGKLMIEASSGIFKKNLEWTRMD